MSEMLVISLDDNMMKALDDFLHCRLCKGYYNYCVLAKCGHNFCAHCIRKRMRTDRDCPYCFEDINEGDLRNNKLIDRIVRIHEKLRTKCKRNIQGDQMEILMESVSTVTNGEQTEQPERICPKIELTDSIESIIFNSDICMEEINDECPLNSSTNACDTNTGNSTIAFSSSNSNVHCQESETTNTMCMAVFQQLQTLQAEMASLKHSMTNLRHRQSAEVENIPSIRGLPLESLEAMRQLEENLADGGEFAKYKRILGEVGGRDIHQVTRNILRVLISNSLAVQLNWIGGYGKAAMKSFPLIIRLISAAVRETPITQEAKQAEVVAIIKRWLRTALDRNGGRGKRKSLKGAMR